MAQTAAAKASAPEQAPGRGRIYESVTDTIGNTPLVRLRKIEKAKGLKANLLAKLEFFNPLASVKDRIRRAYDFDARSRGQNFAGQDDPDRTDLRQYGHRARLRRRGPRLPADPRHAGIDVDRTPQMLALLGAELVLTPAAQGMKGAIAKAQELSESTPDSAIPRQFDNPSQCRDSQADHGGGNLERHRRPYRRVRRRRRHRRHDLGRRPGAEAASAGPENRRGRARGFAGSFRRRRRPAQNFRASAPASFRRFSIAPSSTRW